MLHQKGVKRSDQLKEKRGHDFLARTLRASPNAKIVSEKIKGSTVRITATILHATKRQLHPSNGKTRSLEML